MFNDEYRNRALQKMVGASSQAVVSDESATVWDCMNRRIVKNNERWKNRLEAQRAHIIKLESKLAERRAEFSQSMVIALILSKCKRYVLAGEIDGALYLPGAITEIGETSGETFAAICVSVIIGTTPPRELGISRDTTETGLKETRVFMGAFQLKDDTSKPTKVQWWHIGDNRISESERAVIKNLLES